MKKFTFFIVFLVSAILMFAQTATIKIGTIDNAQPGTILLPITLEEINPVIGSNLISSWRWYIAYDASVLNAGIPGSPATLVNYDPEFQTEDYFTNIIADNPSPGWNTIEIVYSSAFSGMGSVGMKFFDIQFSYLNGSSNLTWTSYNGFPTNMEDDEANEFILTTINGSVFPSFEPVVTLNLKLFLEGPYFDNEMTTFLNILGYLPFNQPYNNGPWNYHGNESVTAIPNANVVDWVLVELLERHFGSEEYLFIVKARKAGFLINTGEIKDLNGTDNLFFNNIDATGLYLRVHHRNHLPIISSESLSGTNGNYIYDFTTGVNQAIGGANVQKQLNVGLWGAMTGDGNANKQIDNKDKNELWLIENNSIGYYRGDYNMDSQVDNYDLSINWKSNAGRGLPAVRDSIPPLVLWACGETFVDIRDNQSYTSVQIGDQCWMAENLNIGTRIDGIGEQTDNAILEKYCYNDDEANCETYGGLYQWNEMMQYNTTPGLQGICPTGWHVPADGEWTVLTNFLGGEFVAGGKMKETGTIEDQTGLWHSPNTGATNESGFTVLPAGERYVDGDYFDLGYYPFFWSSEGASNPDLAWSRYLLYSVTSVYRMNHEKGNGFSVRCVKDTIPTWSCGDVLNDTRDGETYNTVEIGSQCWMSENLNIGTRVDVIGVQSDNAVFEKYCYDDDEANCAMYGGLYQWNEMMQYITIPGVQGICPTGWHLPTDGEWCTLAQTVDPTVNCSINGDITGTDAGTKMKSTSGWYFDGNGTNTAGFTALPGGYNYSGTWALGHSAYFWTSTSAWTWMFLHSSNGIYHQNFDWAISEPIGYSVRCVQD